MKQLNAPYDFLYIPQLWEPCTEIVLPTADLQIYLYLTISNYLAINI